MLIEERGNTFVFTTRYDLIVIEPTDESESFFICYGAREHAPEMSEELQTTFKLIDQQLSFQHRKLRTLRRKQWNSFGEEFKLLIKNT